MDTLFAYSNNHHKNINDDLLFDQKLNKKSVVTYSSKYYHRKGTSMNKTDFRYVKKVTLQCDMLYIVRHEKDIIPGVFNENGINLQLLEEKLNKRVFGILLFDIKQSDPYYYPVFHCFSLKKCIKDITLVSKRVSVSDHKERKWISVENCFNYKLTDCISSASCAWSVNKTKLRKYRTQINKVKSQFRLLHNTEYEDLRTLYNDIKTNKIELSKLQDKTFECSPYQDLQVLNFRLLSKIMKPYKYYIFSPHKMSSVDNLVQTEKHFKPIGLWFALGDEWLKYLINNRFRLHEYNYLYEIEIKIDKVLTISNLKELKAFGKEFRAQTPTFGYNYEFDDVPMKHDIDWKKMATVTKKNGLIIDKNFKNLYFKYDARHDMKQYFKDVEWYITWDIASGVIWHKDAIKEITLIYKKEEGVEIPYRK